MCLFTVFFFLCLFFVSNVMFGIFLYTREVWDEWDWELDFIEWKVQYFYYELGITGLSDVFWDDLFFPWDNIMYPEFRFFFIYTDDIVLYWA